LAFGEEVRRAQSRGEWPGVRSTFSRGLVGIELCVGGRAREELDFEVGERFGRGERRGGDMRLSEGWRVGTGFNLGGPRLPPEARCAEFAAGKEGAGGESSSWKVGMGVVVAQGVVGDEGRFLKGGGGGGIALRSRSSFEMRRMSFDSACSSWFGGGAFCLPIA